MLDATLRPYLNRPLAVIARRAVGVGLTANQVTAAGFAIGMVAVALIAGQVYSAGLIVLLISRLCDGLDGAIARQVGVTDVGGFLDITLDFIFYASVVLAFAFADPPANALAAAVLAASFMGPASTFLAYAIFAAKHGITTEIRGRKSLYYLGGLTEGTETISAFVLMCLFPARFPLIAVVYAGMCWLTAGTRIYAGVATFSRMAKGDRVGSE